MRSAWLVSVVLACGDGASPAPPPSPVVQVPRDAGVAPIDAAPARVRTVTLPVFAFRAGDRLVSSQSESMTSRASRTVAVETRIERERTIEVLAADKAGAITKARVTYQRDSVVTTAAGLARPNPVSLLGAAFDVKPYVDSFDITRSDGKRVDTATHDVLEQDLTGAIGTPDIVALAIARAPMDVGTSRAVDPARLGTSYGVEVQSAAVRLLAADTQTARFEEIVQFRSARHDVRGTRRTEAVFDVATGQRRRETAQTTLHHDGATLDVESHYEYTYVTPGG